MGMLFERKLAIPKEVKEMYPLTAEMSAVVSKRAEEIRDIFTGKDDRFLLIIGPCSADREDSVIDYISRLRKVADKVQDKIFIIPRIYTNKPRTTGEGYKGIVAIRELHMRALAETGFSCADEMLYPENHRYLDDVLAYVAVGARSVEDQQHRLTASGVDIPVGMKNPTSGGYSVMINAIKAAQHGHTFTEDGRSIRTAIRSHMPFSAVMPISTIRLCPITIMKILCCLSSSMMRPALRIRLS